MRFWKWLRLVLTVVALGALVAWFVFVLQFAWAFRNFGAPSPQEREAREHCERGEQLETEGRLDEAIAEFRLAAKDGLYPMMTRRIADRLEQAGRFEEALAEIDRKGPAVSWGEYCDLRCDCLSQWKGADAAVAWLLERDAEQPEKPFFQDQLGTFHFCAGRPQQALAPLHEAVRRALVGQPFAFDEHDLMIETGGPLPLDWDDLPDLWPTLEHLAQAYEQLGDDANAWKQATRAVSFHSRMNRMQGYDGERWQAAGSFTGRMVRARVLLRRGDLDDAAAELDFAAEVLSSYPPHEEELAAARAELARRRAAATPAQRR